MKKFIFTVLITIFLARPSFARDVLKHQVNFSITLSGHILFGAGYTYWFNDNHAVEATIYPLMVPGKGFPFALSAGYGFYPGGEYWRGKLGTEMTLLVSPPGPDKRKTMPMLSFTPGFLYKTGKSTIQSEIWYSWFLKNARKKMSFTGIELKYGHFIEH